MMTKQLGDRGIEVQVAAVTSIFLFSTALDRTSYGMSSVISQALKHQ
jgi:hypothetical protein